MNVNIIKYVSASPKDEGGPDLAVLVPEDLDSTLPEIHVFNGARRLGPEEVVSVNSLYVSSVGFARVYVSRITADNLILGITKVLDEIGQLPTGVKIGLELKDDAKVWRLKPFPPDEEIREWNRLNPSHPGSR